MDILLLIILCYLLFYYIGLDRGKKIGEKNANKINYYIGYKKGIKTVEEEMCLLSKLDDKEIVKRVKNLSKKYEN